MVPSRFGGIETPAISASAGVAMYLRVYLCDCLTGEEVEELGFFAESFARRFAAQWNESALEFPSENRIVQLEQADISKAA